MLRKKSYSDNLVFRPGRQSSGYPKGHRTNAGGCKVNIRGLLTVVVLGLCAGVLSSCSGGQALTNDVAQDPEALSRAVVEAAYEENYEFLWEYASPRLKSVYEQDFQQFGSETAQRGPQILQEGSVDAGDAQATYSQQNSVIQYDLVVSDPTSSDVVFLITLVPTSDETWSYCKVSVEDPRLGESYILIGEVGEACY